MASPFESSDSESPSAGEAPHERRVHERLPVAPMYSAVEAKPVSSPSLAGVIEGHVYDVSLGGARIELDDDVAIGEDLQLDLRLPAEHAPVRVIGSVVRRYDEDDDPVARRLGIRFERFVEPADELRLRRYLHQTDRRLAA